MTTPGAPIPNSDNVIRWCTTTRVDQVTSWPKVEAFYLREGEDYLSFNWIEFFDSDRVTAVNALRDCPPFGITIGGRFAVLNVGALIESIIEGGGLSPSVQFCPEPDNPSHVAVAWDDMLENHHMVAVELLALVNSGDIFPGKIS